MRRSTRDHLMPRARIALASLWDAECQGAPLSIRDICRALGVTSQSTVHGHLHVLEKLGFITRAPLVRNGIRVTEAGRKMLEQP